MTFTAPLKKVTTIKSTVGHFGLVMAQNVLQELRMQYKVGLGQDQVLHLVIFNFDRWSFFFVRKVLFRLFPVIAGHVSLGVSPFGRSV